MNSCQFQIIHLNIYLFSYSVLYLLNNKIILVYLNNLNNLLNHIIIYIVTLDIKIFYQFILLKI